MTARLAALLALALLSSAAGPASAKPAQRTRQSVRSSAPTRSTPPAPGVVQKPQHDGAHARVAINHLGDLRPGREAVGRREEPLTAEEDTAKEIEKLLRGPLRYGVTGLFVADARTGEALFAVNAEDPLNPASNVKMISTATALDLLGADFKYATRLLGATPDAGVIHGDVYLLGSYDPTLSTADLDDIAAALAARGVRRIDGSVVVGADPTRDGIYRATIPFTIHAGEPGGPAFASTTAGDFVTINVAAKTARAAERARLSYRLDTANDAGGRPHVTIAIGGTIGRGGAVGYAVGTRERTALAVSALRAALHTRGISVVGGLKVAELDSFIASAAAAGNLPVELGRHDSARLATIIAHVNKWSINWLADRVIMTAAALARSQPPSMDLALAAMYDWLGRHPRIAKEDLVVDTGSGLSYHTRITTHELVSILRSAAGYAPEIAEPGSAGRGSAPESERGSIDPAVAQAWRDSLSIGGTDGTLASRFRSGDLRGRIRGKTGTLSTAIALSGILDFDPQRPLAFSLVTNGDSPLSPRYVRRAHEQLVGLLCRYLARTQKTPAVAPLPLVAPTVTEPDHGELDELEPDTALDDEAAGQH